MLLGHNEGQGNLDKLMADQNSKRAKYEVTVDNAQSTAIGDYALVEQHFHLEPPPVPPLSREELLKAISQASADLRAYCGEIAGIHIDRPEVEEIAEWAMAADREKRLGMLLDRPGGGKTVVMRDVLERIETHRIPTLAIKADWLSGVRTRDDLAGRLDLPAPVEQCARALASEGLFVVILDQLDALSLALSRDQATLDVMLSTLARLRDIENVRIIASCRVFELENDPLLSSIKADRLFKLKPLDQAQVSQVLNAIDIDPDSLLPGHRDLISIPLHLDVYAQVIGDSGPIDTPESFQTLQELYEELWRRRVMAIPPWSPSLRARRDAIYRLVDEMQSNRQLTAPVAVLDEYAEAARYLEQEGFVRREGGNWLFAHQTLFDYCYARRFVATRQSLSEEILSGSQGLFERSQMIQVLVYLRGADQVAYLRELTSLLFSNNLRPHLHLLLVGWFGSLPDPTGDELQIARRLLRDPEDRTRFLRAANANEGWFDQLEEDLVSSLLHSDDDGDVDLATQYLSTLIQKRTDTVLGYLHAYLGNSEVWDARIAFSLSQLDRWKNDKALEMLCDLFRRGRAGGRGSHILYKLAHVNPVAGCQALRAYLERRLEDLLTQERAGRQVAEDQSIDTHRTSFLDRFNWNRQLLGGYGIGEIMEAAAHRHPEAIIEHLLPWFKRTIGILTEQGERLDSYPLDPLFSGGWYEEHPTEGAHFVRHVAEALSYLAQEKSKSFRVIANELAEIDSLAAQRILAHAYLSDSTTYAEDIFHYLMSDPRRLRIGERIGGSPHYDSRRLCAAAFQHVGARHRSALEQLILELQPDWERQELRYRGITQLQFLKAVPRDLLSGSARDRLGELERKFPEFELRSPRGTVGGAVGSPIHQAAQAKMSDEAWLSAMRKYDDSGYQNPDFLKGGVRELASSFSIQVKEAPQRFYSLAERFDEDISLHYVDAAISGLAESNAPSQWMFDLVRRFASRIRGEFRRSTCWALRKRADGGVPDDLLDLMTDWAIRDPDPRPRAWGPSTASGTRSFFDDPYQRGINTNRGAALQTVCCCAMKREPPQVERTFQLLEQAACDPSTAVRTCVIESLRWVLNEDDNRALAVFEETLDGHPRLLRSSLVHRFLYWTYRAQFARVLPLIETLLIDSDDNTRQVGARLACLAAFRHAEAKDLADRAVHGDSAMRQGAAQVYARNLEYEDAEDVCRGHLLQLMWDPDDQVRSQVGHCFMHLRAEHLDRLRPFIEEFLSSPSLMDGAEHLVAYLVPLAADAPELSLDATERILNIAGSEVTDVRKAAAILERDLVRLPLTVHTHTPDPRKRSRAMDLFELLLLEGSRSAHRALEDWDRR